MQRDRVSAAAVGFAAGCKGAGRTCHENAARPVQPHGHAPDICGLLSNAYDNAIETCLPQTDAYIHTKISTTCNYTVVQIVNSVEKKVAIRNNSAVTTKKDRKSHGYGIDIMKQIAYKYNGSCSLHCDSKEFTVKIVLLGSSGQ